MNPEEIRKQTIIALFSDDYLYKRLVLKGGNAIHLVHKLALRSSLDLDFSLSGDFEDMDEARGHLFTTLKGHFSSLGYVVFDEQLAPKPQIKGHDERPWWGGYELKFKLISREKHQRLQSQLEKMRIDALPVGPKQERTFSVDLSKNEYTEPKINVPFDSYTIPVYTLDMIAAEKLRAICQQMPEYGLKGVPTPRARDFYDIHLILTTRGISLTTPENLSLMTHVFQAKQVPLQFLEQIPRFREFHRTDWPSVVDAVGGKPESFDFYFDFVCGLVKDLHSLWVEDPPR